MEHVDGTARREQGSDTEHVAARLKERGRFAVLSPRAGKEMSSQVVARHLPRRRRAAVLAQFDSLIADIDEVVIDQLEHPSELVRRGPGQRRRQRVELVEDLRVRERCQRLLKPALAVGESDGF